MVIYLHTRSVINDSDEIVPGIGAKVAEYKQLVCLDIYGVPLGSIYVSLLRHGPMGW